MSKQEIKKKKGLLKKIGSRFKKEDVDELMLDTLGELKGIVSTMRDVFAEFEDGYDTQLEEDRSSWQKFLSKMPSFMQNDQTKVQSDRMGRIKSNKNSLTELEDNFNKLEMVLTTSESSIESISQAVADAAISGPQDNAKLEELEQKMTNMQSNMSSSLGDINMQISLIKSALDNMAGQLDEQGVVLVGIDDKIDVLDTKMDKAEALLHKISKKLTGNRIIMLVIAGTATAIIAQKFLVN